jgi:multidrug efflux pump subunit AcrA (membrane-fusion protein)
MSSDYDATEFVDGDFQAHKSPHSAMSGGAGQPQRAPTREEVDSRVAEAQQKLAELKREQEELERQRAALEETRRRQMEFQTGREETIQNLTRGVGLLEEAEFSARRDAEQMAKALVDLRDALAKVQAIHEETWTKDNFGTELTRALTTLENARMEWNTARLRFPVLSGSAPEGGASAPGAAAPASSLLAGQSFGELCRIGLALTWPLAAIALLGLAALLAALLRH